MIEITVPALAKMKEILAEQDKQYVRFGVEGGGCAGFNYQLDVADQKEESDNELKFGDIKMLIDNRCEMFILGTKIDYKKETFGAYFTYDNPNASSSCGCGTSFAVK